MALTMSDRNSNDQISPLTPTRPFSFEFSNSEELNPLFPSIELSEVSLQNADDNSESSSGKLLNDIPHRGRGANSHRRDRSESTLVEAGERSVSPSQTPDQPPKNWPRDPQLVKKLDYHKVSEMMVHLLLAFAAASILVFALLSATVDNTYPQSTKRYIPGKPVLYPKNSQIPKSTNDDLFPRMEGTSLNSRLAFWSDLGPTIIPIIFSAIITSSLRLIAKLKAQTGTHLGTLELLFGSSSFSNTLRMIFTLRLYIPLNVSLLALWSLSPLAGQASLRVLTTRNVTDASMETPWNVADTGNATFWSNGSIAWQRAPVIAADYLNAMSWDIGAGADIKGHKFDPNDFPLLPMSPPTIPWNGSQINSIRQSAKVKYYALRGIPTYGPSLSSISSSRYNLQSNITFPVSLFSFSCPDFSIHSPGEPLNKINPTVRAQMGFFTDSSSERSPSSNIPQRIFFGVINFKKVTVWNCSVVLHTRMVTAKCSQKPKSDVMSGSITRGEATHIRVRPAQPVLCKIINTSIANISNRTPLRELSFNLFRTWNRTDFAMPPGFTTPTVSYLATGSVMKTNKPQNTSTVDSSVFSERLTTAFNTFWLTALPVVINSTSATPIFYHSFSVVRYEMLWLIILIITSLLLIVASLFNTWFRYRLYSPDIFGYVSALTIENPHLLIPGVEPGAGSTLDGLQRTRLLKDVMVKIGDVRSGEEFGKLALARSGDGVEDIKMGRRYI